MRTTVDLPLFKVGDANNGFEWQRAVRRSEFIHVVLAVRSAPSVKGRHTRTHFGPSM